MPHIVWTTTHDNKMVYYNQNLLNLLNLKSEEVPHFNFSKIIHPEDYDELKRVWLESSLEKKVFEFEFRIFDFSKQKFEWYLSRATPVFNDNNEIIQWIGTSMNIDEFKSLSEQKDTFLGIASHELKTPLTSLKLYAQVLERMLRKTGDEKNAEFAKKMDVQIVKLTSLIGDLLDVTKINAGKIYLNEEEFDFEKLVVETVDDQQMSTAYKIEIYADSVGTVFADRERVGQVITNLISNAIKYSPNKDKIVIEVKKVEANIEFSVKDFGIGLADSKISKVFEQYFRVTGDEQNTFPGLGLGLYISAQIIERSKGKIWAESVLNEGSTFYFSLPQIKM